MIDDEVRKMVSEALDRAREVLNANREKVEALAARLPVLCVCGGLQLLTVLRGGTLYPDLPADAGVRGHEQPPPKDAPSHEVAVAPGTQLEVLVGPGPLSVNSTHHQAVRR